MGKEDFRVLWVRGFGGDFHGFFCGYGMGIGIEMLSPRRAGSLMCRQLRN